MSNNLISVIIPVYNVEQYLNRCVDSVINQTYKKLEIILVDDGSTDNSGKICDEYALKDNRIKVIHKPNGGVSSARNAGLDIAKGDYIGFVDSDDYIEKDMYEILCELIIKNNTDISCCNRFVFRKNKFVASKKFPKESILSFNEVLNNPKHDFYIWNKLFKKKLIQDIRFDEKLSLGEDILFTYQVLKKIKNITFYKKAKYYYCNNPGSIVRSKIFKKEYLKQIVVYEELIDYCKKNNLKIGYRKYKTLKLNWIGGFLYWIAVTDSIKNKDSLEVLLKHVKKNFWNYVFGKVKFFKKCFIFSCCINFSLTSKVNKLILKLIK